MQIILTFHDRYALLDRKFQHFGSTVVVDAEASFLPVQIRQFILVADGSWTETFEFEIEYTRALPGNLLSPSFVRAIFHSHEGEFQEEIAFHASN